MVPDSFNFDEENRRSPMRSGYEPVQRAALPLLKTARQILQSVMAIADTLPENDEEHIAQYREWIVEQALLLSPGINAASSATDFILFTENATMVKRAARELLAYTSGMAMFGYPHPDYLGALRDELESFRKLFVQWVRSFPRDQVAVPDGWGLYYTEEDLLRWNIENPDEPVSE